MKKSVFLVFALACAGCLAPAPKAPSYWTIDIDAKTKTAFAAVCAPYGGQRLAVLRPDGSIAFDPCNSFAAPPSAIVKDALVSRGGKGSLLVRRIALDCRAAGRREALVELELTKDGRTSAASVSESAASGNYTAAFSLAFEKAFEKALKGMAAEE